MKSANAHQLAFARPSHPKSPRLPRWAIAATCWLAGVGLLTGCASTKPPVDTRAAVSEAVQTEANAMVRTAKENNAVLFQLSTAAKAECPDADRLYRPAFSFLLNGPDIKPVEMRTAIFRASGASELPVMHAHAAAIVQYDGARIAAINGVTVADLAKAAKSLDDDVTNNRTTRITLEDGRIVEAAPVAACPSEIFTDYFGSTKEPFNNGRLEVTPKSWALLASDADERAFIIARSMYFTSAEGRLKLRNVLYAGAAVSGVLKGLTFGASGLLFNPQTAVRMRRQANRQDADAYAVRVMKIAGFDPASAVRFAWRSIDEGASWPGDCDELKFDAERLNALRLSVQGNEFNQDQSIRSPLARKD